MPDAQGIGERLLNALLIRRRIKFDGLDSGLTVRCARHDHRVFDAIKPNHPIDQLVFYVCSA